ncbi:DarT ssDNA thymidine ADP-ribosyltransferase family protein [Bacteroidota bacterium]
MKIINIQLFRKYYKENIRQINDPSRNENFIGHSVEKDGKIIFGFFEIFHADKKDINKFITPFLKMAQDWQAIYELLQNAFDSNSNKFALFTSTNTLLAFNNGEQFSFEGIRSILNIGQSTKESKTNIGKYGVGFKIVHRLIGDTDGLSELNRLSGPILFSWSKYSDLQDLINLNSLDEISQENPDFNKIGDHYICEDSLPWLFKILITNFPCAPKDRIYDLDYNTREDVFSQDDLKALKDTINKYILSSSIFSVNDLNQGTLIFLPLGSEKYKLFSQEHIRQGISLSLSILNYLKQEDTYKKLEMVYFNDISTPFTPADINIEKFVISKEHSEYSFLTGGSSDDEIPEEIEYFIGFANQFEDTTIKNNPNLYLYFPISDEVHNYNFILHCNFFENLSQRTNLADSDRNKKILYAFSQLLIKRLDELKKSNFSKYLRIYSSLLLSDWKSISNSSWVYQSLMVPLIEFCKNNIPTISEDFLSKQGVRVKATSMDISPSDFGVTEFDWFYYSEESLIRTARDNTKLGLSVAGLYELISNSNDIDKINYWLSNHNGEIEKFLIELNKGPASRSTQSSTSQNSLLTPIANNISSLKLFLFFDKNYYSITDIKSANSLLLIDKKLEELKEIFIALGFTVCILDQNEFPNIYNIFVTDFQHLDNENKFLDYFSSKINSVSGELSNPQIENLIQYFNTINAPICDKIIFSISGEKYRISSRLNNYQCYIPDSKPVLKNYIKEKLSHNYIMLDDSLFHLINNHTEILLKDELYVKILEEVLSLGEIIDIIIESDNTNIQMQYLDKVNELILLEGNTYNKDTYEHKILDLVNKINYDGFRTKIVIKTKNGSVVNLENIIYNNKVVFKTDEADMPFQYELSLANILPNYKEFSELIENIIKSFVNFNDHKLRNMVFKVGKQKPKDEIFKELKLELDDAHQLAFILLYPKFTQKVYFEYLKYSIKVNENVATSMNKNKYYVNNFAFIDDNFILSKTYSDITDLLKLNDENPVFDGVNVSLFLKPFIKGNTYYCNPLKYSLKDEPNSQRELLFNFYSEFLNQKSPDNSVIIEQTIWAQGTTNLIQYTNDRKDLLLGFDPLKKVFPSEYGIESENVPAWIYTWINENEYRNKISFLNVIGTNTEDSLLVQLRKYLINKITSVPSLEEIEELATKKFGLLENTLEWISCQDFELSQLIENTDKYILCKNIYSILQRFPQHPIAVVNSINQNNQLVLRFSKQDENETIYSISKDFKESIIALGNPKQAFEKLLNDINPSKLIYEDFYGVDFISAINPHKREIVKKLNAEKLIFIEELKIVSYQSWKNELDNRFKIFKINHSQYLPYKVLVDKTEIVEINENEIDITEDGKIYVTKYDENISELLQKIIGKNGFTKDHYDLFIEKKKNEPGEIDKLFELEFESTPQSIIDQTPLDNQSYFLIGEVKSFKEKLVELLSLSTSPWSGYVYHFTHLENAVEIVKQKKILSRNRAKFKDSAGDSFISTTQNEIKNYARFYFRPLTPTQYYNEGLGRITKTGDLPQCPVPIFFRFKIQEVLEKYDGKCFVSNGNLRHYPRSKLGNTCEFLKRFDFRNLYLKYNECDTRVFMHASQQEFVVKDELDFSDITNYEIICRSDQDKQTLNNILLKEGIVDISIKVDGSYYYNLNPKIEIGRKAKSFKVFKPNYIDGMINLRLKEIPSGSSSVSVYTNDYIEYELENDYLLEVYYTDKDQQRDWLIYTHPGGPNNE